MRRLPSPRLSSLLQPTGVSPRPPPPPAGPLKDCSVPVLREAVSKWLRDGQHNGPVCLTPSWIRGKTEKSDGFIMYLQTEEQGGRKSITAGTVSRRHKENRKREEGLKHRT